MSNHKESYLGSIALHEEGQDSEPFTFPSIRDSTKDLTAEEVTSID
jgi:hypothetical protein